MLVPREACRPLAGGCAHLKDARTETLQFCLAVSLRLDQPLSFPACISTCECGKPIDRSGYHLVTCKHGGGPTWAHNCVVSGWADCARDAGLSCRVKPHHECINNDNRPDIIVALGTGTGESFDLDISLAHPWSSEACRRASVEDSAAAIIREERKIEKYVVRAAGSSSSFVPVVAEHFGRWGKHASHFLKCLGNYVERSEG